MRKEIVEKIERALPKSEVYSEQSMYPKRFYDDLIVERAMAPKFQVQQAESQALQTLKQLSKKLQPIMTQRQPFKINEDSTLEMKTVKELVKTRQRWN